MQIDHLPAWPFYVGDWLKDPVIRSLPLDIRAIWFEMLCYMWESSERGVLIDTAGNPYTPAELARMIGTDENAMQKALEILGNKRVYSVRTIDNAIYSRRLVRDEERRQVRVNTALTTAKRKFVPKRVPKPKLNTENETENEYENELKNNPEKLFQKTLEEFRVMRKSIRHPLTPYAEKLMLKKLDQLAPGDIGTQIEIMNNSIEASWQGLFPLKTNNQRQQFGRQNITSEEIKAQAERLAQRMSS